LRKDSVRRERIAIVGGTLTVDIFSTINTLTLRLTESGEDAAPRSNLLHDGTPTSLLLNGVVLEAALRWRDCYVLFVTDDVPFEDALHIYLLDANFHLLDSATLASIYSTGSFAAMQLLPPNRVSFHFFGDANWEVELLPEPQARLPFFSDPRGVTRPFAFSQRLIVRGAT
jgi:hypothetical protein